jgi:hypothetical protein
MFETILTWMAIILLGELAIVFPIVIGIFLKHFIEEMRGCVINAERKARARNENTNLS